MAQENWKVMLHEATPGEAKAAKLIEQFSVTAIDQDAAKVAARQAIVGRGRKVRGINVSTTQPKTFIAYASVKGST